MVISLDAMSRAVLESNPAIKEARAKWQALRQRAPQVAAWDDLKVSAGSRVGRFVRVSDNGFTDQMLSVEQMLPISGKNKSRERIAAAEALMALEELRRMEFDAISKAHASFYNLANAYALLDLNSADDTSLQQTLEITRANFESGGMTQAEALTAENELTRIHEVRQDLQESLSQAETKLSVLMNRDPFQSLGKPMGAAPNSQHFSVERLKALVITNRPEVRMAENAFTLAQAKLELAKREWIPDPALSVQAQRYNGGSQAVSELAVGISINLPWLNGKKYRAGEKEAVSGVEAAQQAINGARIEALGMLRDQLRKIETLQHHIELFRDRLLPTAKQTVDANRAGYETAKTGLRELLTSQRNLRELQTTYQKHQTDYASAVAELEAVIGADSHDFYSPTKTTKGNKQ